jgi:hypothetical protein
MKTLDEKRDANKIHEIGIALKKHKPLNDPFCFQLGFVDGWDACFQELTKVIEDKDRVIEVMREALEFYKDLPMSKQDQLWTQELADKCIRVAHQALEQAEKLKGNE